MAAAAAKKHKSCIFCYILDVLFANRVSHTSIDSYFESEIETYKHVLRNGLTVIDETQLVALGDIINDIAEKEENYNIYLFNGGGTFADRLKKEAEDGYPAHFKRVVDLAILFVRDNVLELA